MKRSLLITCIISLAIPISIKAGSVSLSCNDTNVTKGNSTTCTLTGSSNEEVSAISANLSSSGGVSISNINISSIWQGDGSGGNIQLYTDNNKTGGFSIATFTATVNGEGYINVGGVTFSDSNFTEKNASGSSIKIGVKQEIKEEPKKEQPTNNQTNTNTPQTNTNEKEEKKSNDASLKEISISNGTIEFNPNTLKYTVEVSHDIEAIQIKATPNDIKANVKIPTDLNLKDGENKFIIEVTAEDGTKQQYEINVIKLDKVLSNDSSLKSLTIEGHDIEFNKEKYIYNIGKINEATLKINAITNDTNATVKIHGNESIGKDDAIVIEVEAEDKSKKEYIIYVSNEANKRGQTSKIATLIIWILLLISLGFNILHIYKKKNKKCTEK